MPNLFISYHLTKLSLLHFKYSILFVNSFIFFALIVSIKMHLSVVTLIIIDIHFSIDDD